MSEEIAKKQVIRHIKTPYARIRIGGEEFTANNQHRHNWGFGVWYEPLTIEANPQGNAWRVEEFGKLRIVTKLSEVIDIAEKYLQLCFLTWDCWVLSAAENDNYLHPKSWAEIKRHLNPKYGFPKNIFYEDESKDVLLYIFYADKAWKFSTHRLAPSIQLMSLTAVVNNMRWLSKSYGLTASDWCYGG